MRSFFSLKPTLPGLMRYFARASACRGDRRGAGGRYSGNRPRGGRGSRGVEAPRILGTAAAASSRSTVIRTISDPARARAATWATVASTSAVSVLVIDWTTRGALAHHDEPTRTPTVRRRGRGPAWLSGRRGHRGHGAIRISVTTARPPAVEPDASSLRPRESSAVGATPRDLEHLAVRLEAFLAEQVLERARQVGRGQFVHAAAPLADQEGHGLLGVVGVGAGDIGVLTRETVPDPAPSGSRAVIDGDRRKPTALRTEKLGQIIGAEGLVSGVERLENLRRIGSAGRRWGLADRFSSWPFRPAGPAG